MNFGSIIHDVLRTKYADCVYAVGEDYESLVWFSEDVPKPSVEELMQAIEDYKANQKVYDWKQLRQSEMPGIDKQLELLWDAIDKGEDLRKSEFYLSIKAVKEKYPKGVSNER